MPIPDGRASSKKPLKTSTAKEIARTTSTTPMTTPAETVTITRLRSPSDTGPLLHDVTCAGLRTATLCADARIRQGQAPGQRSGAKRARIDLDEVVASTQNRTLHGPAIRSACARQLLLGDLDPGGRPKVPHPEIPEAEILQGALRAVDLRQDGPVDRGAERQPRGEARHRRLLSTGDLELPRHAPDVGLAEAGFDERMSDIVVGRRAEPRAPVAEIVHVRTGEH